MDYGAPFTGETDDVRLGRIFADAGLPVPRVHAAFADVGCLLLEDLGDRTLESVVGAGRKADDPESRALMESAVRLAAEIAVRGTRALQRSEAVKGPCLDSERFRFEMDFYLEHYRGSHLGLKQSDTALRQELHRLADLAADTPGVLCHRDYHSRNLMVRRDGSLAMVDIQDARWGPEGYDLASLLYDAYVDLEVGWSDELIEFYRSLAGTAAAPEEFRKRFDRLAAQRMIKALGTFGFQAHERGNPRYLSGVPRTLDRLRRVLPASGSPPGLFELMSEARLLG